MFDEDRLILVTNDDGFDAKGFETLVNVMTQFGKVVAVAPVDAQSGMGHAITIKVPLRLTKIKEEENLNIYKCNGTPVDCIKIALDKIVDKKPDLIVSGINHGNNTSVSVFYSGTVSGAVEGALNNIVSLAFSLDNLSHDADFSAAEHYAGQVTRDVLSHQLPKGTCLNINIPRVHQEDIKGILTCRQTKGAWVETFDQRMDPGKQNYYWLTGSFYNYEDHAEDTDEWAVRNNYVAVVPLKIDMTSYETLEQIKKWPDTQ